MIFFKKPKQEDLLPPPPPFPSLELEEKPEFFDETIKPFKEQKEESFPEVQEFGNLIEDLKKETKVKKTKLDKKEKIKKKIEIKKPKIQKSRESEKIQVRKAKGIESGIEFPELGGSLDKELDIELPEELKEPEQGMELPDTLGTEEIELPEKLEELGIEQELMPETKPKEILEAEEEIKSAIERIKGQEKPSFFKSLFAKKKEPEKMLEPMPEISETNGITAVQNSINKAREALIKFDLDTAKRSYADVMKMYNKLKPEKQAKVYHEIKELYLERKSAEELKV
ncbi:hypothetical protein HYX02_07150 [Candidatus Woesearchaeota archaeon]|nr:hypothetical protein [Candidatus Woesearchaeota archaeon]